MTGVRAKVAAATDVGRKRSQNEDSHLVWIPEDAEELARRGILLMVADGMGGALAGEIASRHTVETVLRCYREGDGTDPLEDLRRAVEEANRSVHEMSRSDPELNGMGTTCTVLVIRDSDAWIAHVGDSRAYLDRAGRLRQLTHDHTLVAELVERNQIRMEDARTDARRNVVTRSVGVGEQVQVDAFAVDIPLEPGDTLLLCSDGLHGPLTDAELAEAIHGMNPEEASQHLVALANDVGGPDNITVIIAQVEPLIVSTPAYTGPERRRARPAYTGPERRNPSAEPYSGPERRRPPEPAYAGPERRGMIETPPPGPAGRTQRLVILVLVAAALALAAWSVVWLLAGRASSRHVGRVGLGAVVHSRG